MGLKDSKKGWRTSVLTSLWPRAALPFVALIPWVWDFNDLKQKGGLINDELHLVCEVKQTRPRSAHGCPDNSLLALSRGCSGQCV